MLGRLTFVHYQIEMVSLELALKSMVRLAQQWEREGRCHRYDVMVGFGLSLGG